MDGKEEYKEQGSNSHYEIVGEFQALRLSISGDWKANDFINVFSALNELNNYYSNYRDAKIALRFLSKGNNLGLRYRIKKKESSNIINDFIYSFENNFSKKSISILSINYNSPGNIDFTVGLSYLKVFLDLIQHYVPNKEQKLKNKKLELENQRLELENILLLKEFDSKFIKELKDFGVDDVEIENIKIGKTKTLNKLISLIRKGKIGNIEIINTKLS